MYVCCTYVRHVGRYVHTGHPMMLRCAGGTQTTQHGIAEGKDGGLWASTTSTGHQRQCGLRSMIGQSISQTTPALKLGCLLNAFQAQKKKHADCPSYHYLTFFPSLTAHHAEAHFLAHRQTCTIASVHYIYAHIHTAVFACIVLYSTITQTDANKHTTHKRQASKASRALINKRTNKFTVIPPSVGTCKEASKRSIDTDRSTGMMVRKMLICKSFFHSFVP